MSTFPKTTNYASYEIFRDDQDKLVAPGLFVASQTLVVGTALGQKTGTDSSFVAYNPAGVNGESTCVGFVAQNVDTTDGYSRSASIAYGGRLNYSQLIFPNGGLAEAFAENPRWAYNAAQDLLLI